MIIEESDSDTGSAPELDAAGTAYREALTSADGFTRGQGGRIKFNKDTKKRRREEVVEDEDAEMSEAGPHKLDKKQSEVRLGHEFRAKVRKRHTAHIEHS
jgi:ribosomal RNA-processing protein 12